MLKDEIKKLIKKKIKEDEIFKKIKFNNHLN
jgi:hypothetical protein